MPRAVYQLVKANQVYLLHSEPWLLVGEVILSHPVKRLRSVCCFTELVSSSCTSWVRSITYFLGIILSGQCFRKALIQVDHKVGQTAGHTTDFIVILFYNSHYNTILNIVILYCVIKLVEQWSHFMQNVFGLWNSCDNTPLFCKVAKYCSFKVYVF